MIDPTRSCPLVGARFFTAAAVALFLTAVTLWGFADATRYAHGLVPGA